MLFGRFLSFNLLSFWQEQMYSSMSMEQEKRKDWEENLSLSHVV